MSAADLTKALLDDLEFHQAHEDAPVEMNTDKGWQDVIDRVREIHTVLTGTRTVLHVCPDCEQEMVIENGIVTVPRLDVWEEDGQAQARPHTLECKS